MRKLAALDVYESIEKMDESKMIEEGTAGGSGQANLSISIEQHSKNRRFHALYRFF